MVALQDVWKTVGWAVGLGEQDNWDAAQPQLDASSRIDQGVSGASDADDGQRHWRPGDAVVVGEHGALEHSGHPGSSSMRSEGSPTSRIPVRVSVVYRDASKGCLVNAQVLVDDPSRETVGEVRARAALLLARQGVEVGPAKSA